MLGTGRSSHYLPLEYKPIVIRIQYVIHIPNDISPINNESFWISASSIIFYDQLFKIYSTQPRSYQFDRYSPSMFEHWISWHWQEISAYLYILPNRKGYVIISQPDGKNCDVYISEWRAFDIDAETTLLLTAAVEIRRQYRRNSFLLHTLPQHTTLEKFEWVNVKLISEENGDVMIRNIRLTDDQLHKIKMAYESKEGTATFWLGEYY